MSFLNDATLIGFQVGNGQPLNLDNLARRVMAPLVERHGGDAFGRGLATNLHALDVDGKTVQATLRHGNVSLTMNVYVKTVVESQVNAMDALSAKLGTCNDLATEAKGLIN